MSLAIVAVTVPGSRLEGVGWFGGNGLDITHFASGSTIVDIDPSDVTIGQAFDFGESGLDVSNGVQNLFFAIFDGPAVGQSPNERVVLAQVNVRVTAAVAGDVITISVGQDETFANDNSDPIFVSSRIDHTIVIEGDDELPAFVEIADGLGRINPLTGRADMFISPSGDYVPHISFTLTMTTSLTDLSSNVAAYTGPGVAPTILWFEPLGGGRHNVLLSHSIEPGNWLRLTLRATGAGGDTTFDVWLAHQPLDITQDGCTNIQDATAFGQEFNGDRRSALIDINGDGRVNVQDATAFGNSWSDRWANTCLPAKP